MPEVNLERFIVAKRSAGCSPNTLYWYRMCIGNFVEWTITEQREYKKPDTIETYLAHLRQTGKKTSTVSGYYTALQTWFNWLCHRQLIDDNPMRYCQKPKVIKQIKTRVLKDEFLSLYNSLPTSKWIDQRDRSMLLILFYSGLRLTETLNLKPTDVDLDNLIILVERGKGDKPRPVPCHPVLRAELPRYLEMRPPFSSEYLFVADDGHGRVRGQLTVGGLRTILQRRFRDANLPYRNPHAFRHAFAMEFLNAGMEMSAVSAAMGHSSVRVTESVYAGWLVSGLQREYNEALQRMSR